MIARMKRFTLLCTAASRDRALERLQALGCGHLDFSAAASAGFSAARGALADAEAALRIVLKAAAERRDVREAECVMRNGDLFEARERASLTAVKRSQLVAAVLEADAARHAVQETADGLRRTIRAYAPFGDFDPELAAGLERTGRAVRLFKVSGAVSALADRLPASAVLSVVAADGQTSFCAVVFEGSAVAVSAPGVEPVAMPAERLSSLYARLRAAEKEEEALAVDLARAADRAGEIAGACPGLRDALDFEAARAVLETQGVVSWISGWVPESEVPSLRAKAVSESWGLALRDPEPGEIPPTLIRPPKLFRPVKALFDGLGIAPGYTESDVSVPFLAYFSVFFAMLVGDGAYGAIFLAATLWGWRKTKVKGAHRPKVVRSWLTLLTVFSVATVAWGALSNTWFGAGLPFAADWPTVKWLADPSYHNMMLLCFTIGVSHLMLARIWNGVCRINDTTCLAEFGWAGILLFMYFVTNSIVGIFPGVPRPMLWVFGASLLLVFGFTVKPSELRTRGAELGMLPLNVMSALGDIISYVRLFAVGLASVKVAENFNAMATGLVHGGAAWWVNALMGLAMVLILLVGHLLNLAMAGLSVLVHAVRLNTLEFSNHKGVSWSGYAFSPFRRRR